MGKYCVVDSLNGRGSSDPMMRDDVLHDVMRFIASCLVPYLELHCI